MKVEPATGKPLLGADVFRPRSYQPPPVLPAPPSIEAVLRLLMPGTPGALVSITMSRVKLVCANAMGLYWPPRVVAPLMAKMADREFGGPLNQEILMLVTGL